MILAMPQRYTESELGTGRYYNDAPFTEIFSLLGVLTLPVSSTTCIDEVVDMCDGLVLIGGGIGINPARYGDTPIDSVHERADELDTLDYAFIDAFHNADKPILGICRGIEILNVFFGGTLNQDIPNHSLGKSGRHNISIASDSHLCKLYKSDVVSVNSLHRQAIRKVAEGFRITAVADDGIIEAIERDNIIGVQWHPEIMDSVGLFEYFVELVQKSKNKN